MLHNLRAEIARKGLKQDEMAAWLGIKERALRRKINGEGRFSFPQARQLKEKFFPDADLEYLFEDGSPDETQNAD